MQSPFSVARHFGKSERAVGAALLVIFLVATAILAAVTFARATTPWSVLPDADYWGNIWGLITESGVTLHPAALFRHNNEHLVVIPKLIFVANYLALSGSNAGLILYAIAAGAACAGLLLLLASQTLGDTPWRLALCAALFPIVMFSAKLTHSYFYGMSGAIWLTADLFVIGSAAALARLAATGSTGWLFLSLFAAILGALAYSTALYMLLVVSSLRSYTARNAKKAIAEIALRQEIPSLDLVKAVTPALGELERMLPALRATRHVPFDRGSRCEALIGKKLPAQAGRGNGRLDSASPYAKFGAAGEAVALSGWAERDGVAVECIVIADSEEVGIGAGASVLRRPDLKYVKRKPSERIGWKSVARLPLSGPVCAFALFRGDDRPAELSPCRVPARPPPTGG